MKKILSILVLFVAFTINANAQDKQFKKVDEKVEAKANLASLSEVVKFDAELGQALFGLFEYKYRNLNENIGTERKAELARIIEAKLRATLSADQMKAIEDKKGLLEKLTH